MYECVHRLKFDLKDTLLLFLKLWFLQVCAILEFADLLQLEFELVWLNFRPIKLNWSWVEWVGILFSRVSSCNLACGKCCLLISSVILWLRSFNHI